MYRLFPQSSGVIAGSRTSEGLFRESEGRRSTVKHLRHSPTQNYLRTPPSLLAVAVAPVNSGVTAFVSRPRPGA